MRHTTLGSVLLTLLLLLGIPGRVTRGEEGPAEERSPVEKQAPKPLTPEQAADAISEAVRAGDRNALLTLAGSDDPDPWLVADELCYRGEHDTAEAFAKAAHGGAVEQLPRYVAARRGEDPDTEARKLLATIKAALELDEVEQTVADLEGAVQTRLDSVCRVRLAHARGMALRRARRLEESAVVLQEAAEAAEALGWLRRTSMLLHESGLSAWNREDSMRALSAWTARLKLVEKLEARACVAETLGNIGTVHHARGDYAKARSFLERALGMMEECGDRAGVARSLAVLGLVHRALGDYPQALSHLERALVLDEAIGNHAGVARTLGNLGHLHYALGNYAEALSYLERARAVREELGDRAGLAATIGNIGLIHEALGDFLEALSYQERALRMRERLGDSMGVAMSLGNIGLLHKSLGDYPKALSVQERALKMMEEIGDRAGVASTLKNIGLVHDALGDYPTALSYLERALGMKKEIGNRAGMARTLDNIGHVHYALGDYPKALSYLERALGMKEEFGDRKGVAATLGNIGAVHDSIGNYPKALSYQERALGMKEELGDRSGVALTLGNIGLIHKSLGNYPKALSCQERALEMKAEIGDRPGVATTLGNIGVVHKALGDYRKALSYQERALEMKEEIGDRAGVATTLGNIGNVHRGLGDYPKALAYQERALGMKEEIGDRAGVTATLGNIGLIHHALEDNPKALSYLERALAMREEIGDRAGVARTLGNIGTVHGSLGDQPKALSYLERALRAARRLRATPLEAVCLRVLAQVHLEGGDDVRALLTAQRGLETSESLLGGLCEEEGATARAQHASLFAVGTLAAARLGDATEAVGFLESGRSGALLESLGTGRAVRFAALPEALLQAEADARAEESRARHGYGQVLDSGNLRETRRKAKALDEALEQVREVAARIQREAKRTAGLFYPRAAPLEEIQGWLEPGQMLVLYGLCMEEALALAVTGEDARIVSLGSVADVGAICEALDAGDAQRDPSDVLARLRELLVEPLQLGDGVTQVLVSPEGPLCYLPFGALFDRPVAVTPSGTTHVLLRDEEREKGTGILAVGDPDYAGISAGAHAIYFRGRQLTPLAATRAEAQTIGDDVLLGASASEAGFASKVRERKRWRAVHLACHGLLDPERPTLSSLALSGSKGEDGFLTALDVLRMAIPADLAVLSACETGKGKVVVGEGIVGLTRAFMYAGSPRVICSLWKVDDEATRALMVKFYELWNPRAEPSGPERPKGVEGAEREGLGAAAALAKAQAYVRSHEKWKHPHYWAAWVLWGLPE